MAVVAVGGVGKADGDAEAWVGDDAGAAMAGRSQWPAIVPAAMAAVPIIPVPSRKPRRLTEPGIQGWRPDSPGTPTGSGSAS